MRLRGDEPAPDLTAERLEAIAMTHEADLFPDDLPEGRGQPGPITDLIDVEYVSSYPTVRELAQARQMLIEKGYSAITSQVFRQTTGYPYRVEYRGVR